MKTLLLSLLIIANINTFSQSITMKSNPLDKAYTIKRNGLGFQTYFKSSNIPYEMGTFLSLNNAMLFTFNTQKFRVYAGGAFSIENFGDVKFNESFTKLGSDAPGIRTYEFLGNTSAIDGGNVGMQYPFYFTPEMKIIAIKIVVDCGLNGNVSEEYTFNPGFQVSVSYDQLNQVVYVWNKLGNCQYILNKPFKIMLTYTYTDL